MKYKRIEGAEKLSSYITPMMAQLTDIGPFNNNDWLFEIKWDGYRAIAEVDHGNVRLYSRNGLSFTRAYSRVYEALKKLKLKAILDGEIVVFDEDNKPSFQKLQNYSNQSNYPIHFFVFDILSLEDKKLTSLPLVERKEILKKQFPKAGIIQYCDHVVGEGKAFFQQIEKSNLEGMIAKKIGSIYQPGKRTSEWLKIKNVKSEEAVIIGFTKPKGSRIGFGSLLLGQYKNRKLVYIGNVGTGFTDRILKDLFSQLKKIAQSTSPLDVPVKPPPQTTWVKPDLVCNVKFTEKTSDGMIRHPVFLGLRIDKKAKEVVPEKSVDVKVKGVAKKPARGSRLKAG